ncbi:MAG: hypothetical protein NUV46_01065 [Nanoarchaeota archaeon]|nr:hypothetical protein [Nanoarchaeota archaeon]
MMGKRAKSKKTRRHSGRVTPNFAIKGKYSKLIEDALEPQEMWDDWSDYRDGMRNWSKKELNDNPKEIRLGKVYSLEEIQKEINERYLK